MISGRTSFPSLRETLLSQEIDPGFFKEYRYWQIQTAVENYL